MTMKRIHLALTPSQFKVLEKLGDRWGLDLTNTLRHAIARCADQEEIRREKPGRGARRGVQE